jgi:hypothetical protein
MLLKASLFGIVNELACHNLQFQASFLQKLERMQPLSHLQICLFRLVLHNFPVLYRDSPESILKNQKNLYLIGQSTTSFGEWVIHTAF